MSIARASDKTRLILKKVRGTIGKFRLLQKGNKVLVAYSGGPDSTALMAILVDLSKDYELRLALAHLNHQLRPSAAADEEFAVSMARKFGLPLYLKREDIRAHAQKHGLNIEEAGRERRYEFLRQTAAKIGAAKIATGHTMTDQAETVLMRLLRGSGPTGLGGIAPAVKGIVIRPLIEVERGEIKEYLRAGRLLYREDETNRDRRYLRNKVRLSLIPFLEKNFEPRIVRQLSRLAEISRAEDEFLEKTAQGRSKKAVLRKKGKILLDAQRLSSLPSALARRCVRVFLSELKGDLRRISFKDVEAVRGLGEMKDVHLPYGLFLRREKDCIFLKDKGLLPLQYEKNWDGQKKIEINELGLGFTGKIFPRASRPSLYFDDTRRVYLDASKIRFPLVVRSRREGDRYRPLGAPGQKKLKEIMRAKGILPGDRDRHPIFLSAGKIIWILGLPAAEEFKITGETARVLMIEKS
jgi:tRNA(Ile)-lysidine synthase